jgi:hypothetical protein
MTISGISPKLYFTDTDNNPDYTLFVDSGYFYIYDQTAGATRFSINPSGNISTGIGKTITTSGLIVDKVSGVSTITFPAGTNDPGFIQHIEITPNTGIMRFSVGDDNDSNDYFAFGNNNVPDAFRINAMGTVSIGVWQATAIADAYIASASTWNAKQNAITLTTTGSSGAATFTSNTLNIPNYGSALSGYLPLTGGTLTGTLNGTIVNTSSYSRFYNVGVGGAASGTYATYSDAVIGFSNLHLVATTGAVYVNSALALPFYINPVGGNVMIGTTTDAGYKLDVNGTGRFINGVTSKGSAAYNGIFIADNTGTTGGGILSIRQNGVTSGFISVRGSALGNTDRNMAYAAELGLGHYFYVNDGTLSLTLGTTGAATFSSSVTTNGNNIFNNSGGRAIDAVSTGVLFAQNGGAHNIIFGDGNVRYYSLFTPSGAAYGSIRNFSTSSDILTFTSSGNVGIGTTAPDAVLAVHGQFKVKTTNGDGNENRLFFNPGGAADPAQLYLYNEAQSNTIYITANGASYFNSGNFLIGTTTDSGWKLDVNGWGRFTPAAATSVPTIMLNQGNAYANIAGAGDMYHGLILRGIPAAAGDYSVTAGDQMSFYEYGGIFNFYKKQPGVLLRQAYIDNGNYYGVAYFETSDATIKTLIEDNYQTKGIESVVAKLYTKNGIEELGYFAQDVQGILPSAVSKGTDGLLSLSYREVLVAKVQFLEQKVKELEAKLN